MHTFAAEIFVIGVNPYVLLPADLLRSMLRSAGKQKGPVPVRLLINEKEFTQTLVKFAGEWRLYLNTPMRRAAGKDVGDEIDIGIKYDPEERRTPVHPKLQEALAANREAKEKFDGLPPSRQKEIARYINHLKSDVSVERNVRKAIDFLLGRQRFIGRDQP